MTDEDALIQIQSLKNDKGELVSIRTRRHNLQIKNPELFDYLINRFKDCEQISEAIYRLENKIEEAPLCPICGKPLSFVRYSTGYQVFCSKKCKYSEKGYVIMAEKTKQTMNNKYGSDWFTQTDAYNEKVEKTCLSKYGTKHHTQAEIVKQHNRETCKERYGVEYSWQSENNKEKRKKTLKEHYDTDVPMKSEEIKSKYEKTCKERYGADYYVQTNEFHKKSLISRRKTEKEKWLKEGFDIDYIGNGQILVHNCCEKHGDITMSVYTFFNRKKNPKSLCTICNPLEKGPMSYQEIQISNYLKENGISFKMHDRKTLGNGKELDFYIEDKKIAIECNGIYWHSDIAGCDKHYHQEKSLLCKGKDIRLIHIWEDEMNNDSEKVFKFLDRVFDIGKEEIFDYEIERSKNKICISYLDQVVAKLGFVEIKKLQFEILDFWIDDKYVIKGWKNILLRYFIENVHYKKIKSRVDLNIDNGTLFEDNGFKIKKMNKPNCLYVCDRKMERKLICDSEHYWCCYDAGSIEYELKKDLSD